uniref:Uncharacterized protein n=1 Tax=Arundo donax TaxID=35708 RepID=A0A0A9D1T6_ARUDO
MDRSRTSSCSNSEKDSGIAPVNPDPCRKSHRRLVILPSSGGSSDSTNWFPERSSKCRPVRLPSSAGWSTPESRLPPRSSTSRLLPSAARPPGTCPSMLLPLRSSDASEVSMASWSGIGPQKPPALRLRETREAHRDSCSGMVWLKPLDARLSATSPGTRQREEAAESSPERPRPWRERATETVALAAAEEALVQVTWAQLQ